jgi:hypothetical protein
MEKPRKTLAVIMQRRETRNRWESVQWQPWAVLESPEPAGPPRLLVQEGGLAQWLHPGFELLLHRDEAEGYYLNVSSGSPRVFVLWRIEEDMAVPLQVTASYDEGGRWLDGGHSVEGVPMPPEIFAWVGEWVEANYRPQPKKRIRPRSFMHPKDRASQ